MPDYKDNIELAKSGMDQIVDRMAGVTYPLKKETAAFKKSCIREGFMMAVALIEAEEVTPEQLTQ